MPEIAVVIPATHGREANLRCVLDSLANQTLRVRNIVVVDDGGELEFTDHDLGARFIQAPKHEPGMEQPRNIGVRFVKKHWPFVTHVWFVDSDVVMSPTAHEKIQHGYMSGNQNRILIGPYEWLPPGLRPETDPNFWQNAEQVDSDFRWGGFRQHQVDEEITNDLSAGLACFSGNLVWPIQEFVRVGGFWNEIHHGRCEDGELGLRAVAMDVPISWCAGARGYHLWHEVNGALAVQRNERDVPMLNERHPWVERGAVFMVDRDGKAFDCKCPKCGEQIHTILWWQHAEQCGVVSLPVLSEPGFAKS